MGADLPPPPPPPTPPGDIGLRFSCRTEMPVQWWWAHQCYFFPGKKCSCANIYVFYISDVGKEPVQIISDDLYWGFFMKMLCNGKVHLPPLELGWPLITFPPSADHKHTKSLYKNLKKITNCKILFLCRLCGPFVHLFHQVIDNSFPGSTTNPPSHIS